MPAVMAAATVRTVFLKQAGKIGVQWQESQKKKELCVFVRLLSGFSNVPVSVFVTSNPAVTNRATPTSVRSLLMLKCL